MESKEEQVLRTVKSFVVRAGRMTHGQREAMENLWPLYGLEVGDGLLDPVAEFGRTAPLVLEIGFGMGGSLVTMAAAEPECDFIGVEVHPPGVGNILKELHQVGLGNLRVYKADAKDVLAQCIAPHSLSRIQIYFPDPWHKKRHFKRRLIQPAFVESLLGSLEPGGLIHLATDWEPYAQQMMEVLSTTNGLENVCGGNNWALEHKRPLTKFEARGRKLGHGVWDLLFRYTG
jgi:tRNA (guanine-N7-)-methyltransferase